MNSADKPEELSISLQNNSRIGVIGGGPAGSFFSYFFLCNIERLGMDISLDMYEPKDFMSPGPKGCNMCGGIISESLVQELSFEGIVLPPLMVQRGIDSYVLHMDVGTVKIETPLKEKRIGSVHRGGGPRNVTDLKWCSFDGFIQSLAIEKGANLITQKVKKWGMRDGKPIIYSSDNDFQVYDLLVVAVGINSTSLKMGDDLIDGFDSPKSVKTYIREFDKNESQLTSQLGSSMHVFLLDMPELEFAAAIPKGENVSVCVLCNKEGLDTLDKFMSDPVVVNCLEDNFIEDEACKCSPKMNLLSNETTFSDRVIFIGDAGVTRLYKDGIGAAFRTAKAAASTAAFKGVSRHDFNKGYWPTCKKINNDNSYGRFIFFVAGLFKKFRITRKIMLEVVQQEQSSSNSQRLLSTVLWDMFTGSAPYKEIFKNTLRPEFLWNMLRSTILIIFGFIFSKDIKVSKENS